MSLYNNEKPWLFGIKAIAFIIMGILATIQVQYTLPMLLIVFAILLGFNVFLRFGEVFVMKVEKNRTVNLILGSISVVFIIWFLALFNNFDISSEKIDLSRKSVFIVFMVWIGLMAALSLYESIALLIKKVSVAYVFIIDFIFLVLLVYFLNAMVTVDDQNLSKAIFTFGIVCLVYGIVSLIGSKILNKAIK